MIHAQDHIMTAQAEIQLIKRMVGQLRKTEALEKQLKELKMN